MQPAQSVGSVRLRTVLGDPSTPADEADVAVSVSLTDVRNKSDLSDYTGELQADAALRITDKNNPPYTAGTVSDTHFPFAVPCAATSDTTIGSACAVSTSANAVVPG